MTSHSNPAAPQSPFRSTRTTPEEKQEKRAALLLAAVRMFNERGFHATALEDVAASLGVTKPVIYHHLGNKEQVLVECVRIGLRDLNALAGRHAGEAGTGLDRLRVFMRRYAEVIMGDFGRCVVRTGDELLSLEAREQVRSIKREINDALRTMIQGAVEDGSAWVADIEATLLVCAGGLNWSARWYRSDGPVTAEAMAVQLVDALCAGIGPVRA